MNLIVAVDTKWGIGKRNDLLFHLKKDMQHFVEYTRNKVVVMGSNTLLSFPGSKPLKNRTNIVLWPGGGPVEGAIVVQSLDELFEELKKYDTNSVFIIGGAMMYRTMLPYCSTSYITKVDADGGAEVFLDNLDKLDNWQLVSQDPYIEDEGYLISFCTYSNKNVITR